MIYPFETAQLDASNMWDSPHFNFLWRQTLGANWVVAESPLNRNEP
jgi:hypothetical protein